MTFSTLAQDHVDDAGAPQQTELAVVKTWNTERWRAVSIGPNIKRRCVEKRRRW